eukprot:scaffold1964_cov252-Isochrysis_galbana.AAC.11
MGGISAASSGETDELAGTKAAPFIVDEAAGAQPHSLAASAASHATIAIAAQPRNSRLPTSSRTGLVAGARAASPSCLLASATPSPPSTMFIVPGAAPSSSKTLITSSSFASSLSHSCTLPPGPPAMRTISRLPARASTEPASRAASSPCSASDASQSR